jgi:hypothetical protein
MKLKVYIWLLVSAVIFSSSLAHAARPTIDLFGLWQMALDTAKADNDSDTYTFFDPDNSEYQYFVVTSHQNNLFKGYACTVDPDTERSYFSGVLDGNNVWVTSWDSISIGTVNRTGTEMVLVNMVQSLDEGSTNNSTNNSSTSSVVATKLPDEISIPSTPYSD